MALPKSSATAQAVAHKSTETKIIDFIGLAHHGTGFESVPKSEDAK
jgi:hypothetical protein